MPDQFLHGVEVVEINDGIRAIRTVKSSVIGIVGTAPDAVDTDFPLDTPVLVTGPRHAATLGDNGTLKDAYDAIYSQGVNSVVVVRVAVGADDAATTANVVGDPTTQTGAWALLLSSNITGQTPKILSAPGFVTSAAVAPVNPVATNLITIAKRLRGIAIVDGPNTTEADAITARGLYGSDRVFIVDPHVRVYDAVLATEVTRPASGYVAGLISRTDQDLGFWHSPSNKVLSGVVNTARPISFNISERETEANRLNGSDVATVIRESGFRLWGNRSCATDPQWAFLSVRRTADMIYESIEGALLWAMDKPFSVQLLKDIEETVAAYLRTLQARGALLGGKVWLDPDLNSETELKAGKLYINFDIEPPAALEHLTIQAYRNGSYYEELVSQVVNA